MNWKQPFERGSWSLASVVFLVSLAVHLLSDAIFQLHFGAHATNHLELWLYTGVAEGTKLTAGFHGGDPIVWLMQLVGAAFPGAYAFYGVMLASAALSSLTATLLFFIGAELYEKKAGFAAGMIYAGMVQPIGLSMSGFTHDHLQLLLMAAMVLSVVKAARSGIVGGIVCSCVYIAAYEAGKLVNPSINLVVGLTLMYVLYTTLDFIIEKALGRRARLLYPACVSVMFLFLFTFGRTYLPPLIEGSLSALPQGRMGSTDILPVSALTVFIRYNILLIILPIGVFAAYKREDLLGLSLAVMGLMLASMMDRGTRIADLGIALLAACALVELTERPRRSASKAENSCFALWPAVMLAALARLSVDYALLGDSMLPQGSGWDLSDATILLLSASAAMAYLILRQSGTRLPEPNVCLAEAKEAAKRLLWGGKTAALAVIALILITVSGNGLEVFDGAYRLFSVFWGSIIPSTVALSAKVAFPALLAALACGYLGRRYLKNYMWDRDIVPAALIVIYASIATMAAVSTVRMTSERAIDPPYITTHLILLSACLLILMGRFRAKAVLALSAAVLLYVFLETSISAADFLIYAAAQAAMLYTLFHEPPFGQRLLVALSIIIFVGLAVNITFVYTAESRKIGPDAEYEVLRWLSENNRGGRILVPWDHGYMAEVVSGLEAASTPGIIDQRIHDLLWMPEGQAAQELMNHGVRYVLLNNESFNVARDREGNLAYRLMGGLVMVPEDAPPIALSDHYAIYRLRHNLTDGHFRLVRDETDAATGMRLMLYEVRAEYSPEWNTTLIGGVAVNVGAAKTVRVLMPIKETAERTYNLTYHLLGVESFQAGEVRDLLYRMPRLNHTGCELRIAPSPGKAWNLTGAITFFNEKGSRDAIIRLYLVPSQGKEVLDTYSAAVRFPPRGKKTTSYAFQGVDDFADYAVDVGQVDGLSVMGAETSNPKVEDVKIYDLSC